MRALKNYRRHKSSDFFLFMLIVDPTRITNLGLPGGNGNKKLMKNLLILSRMKMSHKRVTKMLCILSGFSLSCKNHVFFLKIPQEGSQNHDVFQLCKNSAFQIGNFVSKTLLKFFQFSSKKF